MAFNFNSLEEYYNNSSHTVHNVVGRPVGKQPAELSLFPGLNPSDRIPMFGAGSTEDRIQHLNNNQSGFIGISGKPGEPMQFLMSQKLPVGGSSYQTFNRFLYHKDMATVERNGMLIPAQSARRKLGNVLADGDIADKFYKKIGGNSFVDIRTEARRNNPRTPLWLAQPFVQRGIQRGKDNPKGLLERINWLTAPVIDTVRIAKWMVSPKGLLFNAKQFGLQATNPKMEYGIPIHPNRIYNPLALALQVPLTMFGVHMDRHFGGPLNTIAIRYEQNSNQLVNHEVTYKTRNRLVKLGKEMEVGLFKKSGSSITPPKIKGLMKLYTKFTALMSKLRGTGEPIKTLSGIMGPHSFFGIGQSTMFKSTSGIHRDSYFLHLPESPYNKTGATNHHDSDKISEASKGKGKDLKDFTLETDLAAGLYNQVGQSEWPKSSGTIAKDRIEEFNVMEYKDVVKFGEVPGKKFRDFRTKDENDSYTKSYISRLGMPDYGATKPGESESDLDIGVDMVKVIVAGITFRSYIEDIQDDLSISWTGVKYSGNAASSYMFDSIGRNWGLTLTLPAFTSEELKQNYKNVNSIMGKASPAIFGEIAGGQFHNITVGDIWDDVPIILEKVTPKYNLDSWDIGLGEDKETSNLELPMHMTLELGGKFLVNNDKQVWQQGGRFFSNRVID